jgi:serine/threonine protein kinase
MAPELFDGKSRPSTMTDIYALGLVIYEVCHVALSDESVPKDYSHRSSHINDHSVTISSYLRWLGSAPRDHRAGISLASRRMSGG